MLAFAITGSLHFLRGILVSPYHDIIALTCQRNASKEAFFRLVPESQGLTRDGEFSDSLAAVNPYGVSVHDFFMESSGSRYFV